jgi:hypothetical protein
VHGQPSRKCCARRSLSPSASPDGTQPRTPCATLWRRSMPPHASPHRAGRCRGTLTGWRGRRATHVSSLQPCGSRVAWPACDPMHWRLHPPTSTCVAVRRVSRGAQAREWRPLAPSLLGVAGARERAGASAAAGGGEHGATPAARRAEGPPGERSTKGKGLYKDLGEVVRGGGTRLTLVVGYVGLDLTPLPTPSHHAIPPLHLLRCSTSAPHPVRRRCRSSRCSRPRPRGRRRSAAS